jgi:succinate dehydrogenase / fumarate reductase flavoprotein subunit
MIEIINGAGTIEKKLPGMLRMYEKFGIDMRTTPILIYPTLHYQNGGLEISANGMTTVENLFVAGEAVGGVHGRNRLMGNSLLDIIVFGRNAGKSAGEKCKSVTVGKLNLDHVAKYADELEKAGAANDMESPMLLPKYTHGSQINKFN